MQIIGMLRDLVLFLGDFSSLFLDLGPQTLYLFVLRRNQVLIRLEFRLELHDKVTTLLQGSLIASAFLLVTILCRF